MIVHEARGLESYAVQPGYDPYQLGSDTGWFGSKLVKKVSRAVSKVPGMSVITAPVNVVRDVARGRNVARSVVSQGRAVVADTRRSLPIAASVVAVIPGVGTGIGAGLNALSALSQGKSALEIARAAAAGAIPGGAIANAAVGAMAAGLRGQGLAAIAEAAVRGAVPAKIASAVDFASDVARGKNVVRAALNQAAVAFVPNSAEAKAFAAARTILTSGSPSAAALAAARQALGTEGARRAFDSAVGEASKVAETASRVVPLSTLPRLASRVTSGRAIARHLPLSPRAASFVGNRARNVTLAALNGRRETAGLSADAATYTVESGDSAWKITQKLTGNGNRYRELLASNKQKPQTTGATANFKTLFAGEKLTLPGTWKSLLAPTLKNDVIGQARAILKAWGDTDGLNQAGLTDYGSRPEDQTTTWGPRDRLMVTSFANWRNGQTGKKLSVSGDLTDQIADELRLWAAEHASSPGAPAAPTPTSTQTATPPDVIQAAPPATQSAPAPAVVVSSGKDPRSGTRSVPADVSALAAAAQSSGDPTTMRRAANELYSRGWWDEADLLNRNADELEAQQFGVPSPNATTMPTMVVTGSAPKPQTTPVQATATPAQQGDSGLGLLAVAALVVAKLAHAI